MEDDASRDRRARHARLKRMLTSIVTIAVLSYLGLMGVIFLAQRWLIFPVSHEMGRTPDQAPYRMKYDDLNLPVSNGKMTNAWFIPADNAKWTVLFCRGNGGTLSDWVDAGHLFHTIGVNVLLFDYGGYGRSTGKPSESRLYEDGRAAWRWLTEERKIPANQIVIIGHSIGGGVASQLATEVKPAALVLQSTFTSLPDIAQESLPYFPVKPLVRDRFMTKNKLASITCPLLIVHSPDDSMIPIAHGRALFALAHEPKQFLEIRGDHNDGMLRPAYMQGIEQFIKTLRP